MKAYRIDLENGDIIYTEMNATLEEARDYYVGTAFNFGDTDEHPADLLVNAVTVEEII